MNQDVTLQPRACFQTPKPVAVAYFHRFILRYRTTDSDASYFPGG